MNAMQLFCKAMLWLTEFELAFTPKRAAHCTQLKLDILYWKGQVLRAEIKNGRY